MDASIKKQLIEEIIAIINNHSFTKEEIRQLGKYPSQFAREVSQTNTKGKLGVETFLQCVDMLSVPEQNKIKEILERFFIDDRVDQHSSLSTTWTYGAEYVTHLSGTVKQYKKRLQEKSNTSKQTKHKH